MTRNVIIAAKPAPAIIRSAYSNPLRRQTRIAAKKIGASSGAALILEANASAKAAPASAPSAHKAQDCRVARRPVTGSSAMRVAYCAMATQAQMVSKMKKTVGVSTA